MYRFLRNGREVIVEGKRIMRGLGSSRNLGIV